MSTETSTDAQTGTCPVHPAAPTEFDHNAPTLGEDSVWAAYRDLQQAGPVNYSSAHGGFYLLTRFDDVRAALRDVDTFQSGHGHRVPVVGVPRAIPIDYDAPLHGEYRRIMIAAMTPNRVRELQPFLRELIGGLVADFHAAGGGDAVTRVALPLPLQVLVRVVGFSADTVARLRELTEAMWERVNDTNYDEARKDIRALIDGEIARHRAEVVDDYLTTLLQAHVGDRAITDDEAARVLITMAIAGHETTMNAATSLLWLLAKDPAAQAALRADPASAPAHVEEMLRVRTPAQNFARQTARDTVVSGVPIPAGSRVMLAYAAADRDPGRFPEPDRYDVSRASRGHLAFGWGAHQCIGATLARTELTILLETLLRYPPFELDGAATFGPLQGGVHYGPHRLPVRFTGR